jgi:glutaredoxin
VETFGSTVDATVTEVRARSKHSPPPTPRVRGAADPESLGATPRSARSGGAPSSSRSGGDSHRVFGPDSNRSGVSEFSEGWTSVVVLYVTSVSAVRRTAGRCQRVRQTLANLGVEFLERDVSMATAYKDELARRIRAATGTTANGGKEKTRADDANDDDDDDDDDDDGGVFGKDAFGKERDRGKKPSPPGKPPTSSGSSSGSGTNSELVVPCLFVDDAFVGSGEALDVSAGDGSLRALLEERGRVGRARAEKDACVSCAGRKLVVCDRCDGSMRWRVADKKTGAVLGERRCPWCNEVGMQECGACVPAFARTTGGSRGGR